MYFRSLRNLCENITFALNLGIKPEKIPAYGYLLANYPNTPKYVLQKMPVICGRDMRDAMKIYPKLATVPLRNFEEILNTLRVM